MDNEYEPPFLSQAIFAIGFWLVVSTLVYSCEVPPAYAHDDAILECSNNIVYKSVTKLNEFRMENGLLDEHFDSNHDNIPDVHVLSSIKGPSDEDGLTPHDPNPIFWIVDKDFDGSDDAVYIDIHGEGKCDDIILYSDLTKPNVNPELPSPDDRRSTNKGQM